MKLADMTSSSAAAHSPPGTARFSHTTEMARVQGLADVARHVIQRILNPRLMSQTASASHDVENAICQAECPPRHQQALRILIA
jgi:hypothetical protein